jgi:hypothetical protein
VIVVQNSFGQRLNKSSMHPKDLTIPQFDVQRVVQRKKQRCVVMIEMEEAVADLMVVVVVTSNGSKQPAQTVVKKQRSHSNQKEIDQFSAEIVSNSNDKANSLLKKVESIFLTEEIFNKETIQKDVAILSRIVFFA